MPSALHLTAFPQPCRYVTGGKMAWPKRSIWLHFQLQVVKLKQWKKLLNDWSVMLFKNCNTSKFDILIWNVPQVSKQQKVHEARGMASLSLCNKWCTLLSHAAVLPVKSCAEALTSQNLLSERTCWALQDKDEHSEGYPHLKTCLHDLQSELA